MKKIHLSIPKPCHEDWDAMTPTDKGRFCGSCQKTVIDFTNMSDRQLGEFFRKPPSSVCGRLYDDQLNQNIEIPRKRIPWIRYFFQFTWPAFVLFLKSCGTKDNSKAKVNVEQTSSSKHSYSMISSGYIMPGQKLMISDITPVDTSIQVQKEEVVIKGEIVGEALVVDDRDSVAVPIESLVKEDSEIIYKPIDTVTVQSYGSTSGMIRLGGISICKIEALQEEKSPKEKTQIDEEIKFNVYPNPVRAGSALNVSFESADNFPEVIQILSSSGQLISQAKQNGKTTVTSLQIQSNCAAGIYFLRLITKNKEVKTTKVIVTKRS